MTAAARRVLEKLFANEIAGNGPVNLPASAGLAEAIEEGLVEPVRFRMRSNPDLPSYLVDGFGLTHKGRVTYCAMASEWREVGR